MSVVASFLLAYLAFVALSLSQARHHRRLFARAPSPLRRRTLRVAALLGLLLSLHLARTGSEGGAGVVYWFGALTGAGLLRTLSLREREGA